MGVSERRAYVCVCVCVCVYFVSLYFRAKVCVYFSEVRVYSIQEMR